MEYNASTWLMILIIIVFANFLISCFHSEIFKYLARLGAVGWSPAFMQ